MGSRSYLCRWQVERKVILNVMWLLELNLLIPKQTFTFPSCSPVFPPAPPSPVGSPPACSLPPTVSRTPPSLSASWPSTPVTMASSWSSTPQTLQLQQSRYFVCSSLTPPFHLFIFLAQAAAVCLSSGSWGPTHHLTCVDASQLGQGWLESASLSINIIYILLALLTVLTVPLLLLHCCGRRLCSSCPK